eukprot:COSAG06_NODE_3272_length_5581_cov_19.995987_6_plen_158_part_00
MPVSELRPQFCNILSHTGAHRCFLAYSSPSAATELLRIVAYCCILLHSAAYCHRIYLHAPESRRSVISIPPRWRCPIAFISARPNHGALSFLSRPGGGGFGQSDRSRSCLGPNCCIAAVPSPSAPTHKVPLRAARTIAVLVPPESVDPANVAGSRCC